MNLKLTKMCKGIAIIFIVCCHAFGHSFRYFTPLGGIGVTIFLILSGYGLQLSYQKNGINKYWGKRFIGVYIPFVITDVIYGLIFDRGGIQRRNFY